MSIRATIALAALLATAPTGMADASGPTGHDTHGATRPHEHGATTTHGHGGTSHGPGASKETAPGGPVDPARERWSAHRRFKVAYAATPSPAPVNALHVWTLAIADAAGRPVTGARVTVDGGMPAHDHGLPTSPQVTELGAGRYRVDGVKFHMPGHWVVRLGIEANGVTDRVRFDHELP